LPPTGVECVYDFELRFTTDDLSSNASDVDGIPSLFTALRDTLGLRLQKPENLEGIPADNWHSAKYHIFSV